jgi:hypothetical protein
VAVERDRAIQAEQGIEEEVPQLEGPATDAQPEAGGEGEPQEAAE